MELAPPPVVVRYEPGMTPQDSADEFVERLTRMGAFCATCHAEFVNIVGASVTQTWETDVYFYDHTTGRPLADPVEQPGSQRFYHHDCAPTFDTFNIHLTPTLAKSVRLPAGSRWSTR